MCIRDSFNPSVTFTGQAYCTPSIQADSTVRSGNGFTFKASAAKDDYTEVIVVCGGIANPYNRGEYFGFLVEVTDAYENLMARSDDLTILFDYRKFAADVTSQVVYFNDLQ
eukprot:TRINITY_DN7350_c0_g3_i7.p3 TRINITY_DN7350_c0_g3~~TRINITY_DN7350_c0_g3_i7.p3  ORF type:complete len:111 (+),score=15.23 TRINITY_DN7350_c0_g3_i7:73-405(+)